MPPSLRTTNNLIKETNALHLSVFHMLFISVDVRSHVNVVNLPFTAKSARVFIISDVIQNAIFRDKCSLLYMNEVSC
jgi:hypothetical protein